MKKLFVLLFVVTLVFGISEIASATVLTFDNSSTPGVTYGGSMAWNDYGGGHLYDGSFLETAYIYFPSATTVNSFQMTGIPWQNYSSELGNIDLVSMAAFNSVSTLVWNTTVNLSNYTIWNNWLDIPVNTDNITNITFYPTGTNTVSDRGFWPSIDNMRINETSVIPEPASLSLLGLGLLGLLGLKKRKV